MHKKQIFNINSTLRITGVFLCLNILACSDFKKEEDKVEEAKAEATQTEERYSPVTGKISVKSKPRQEKLVEVKTGLDQRKTSLNKMSFSLINEASKYSISLDNCLSGYSSTSTELNPSMQAYKFDSNCLAKLESFEFQGRTYIPSNSNPFTTWQVGDVAVFEDQVSPSNTFFVEVMATLSSPIVGAEEVYYEFYEDTQLGGNGSILEATIGAQAVNAKGQDTPPDFSPITANFIGETPGGGFTLEFILNCNTVMVGDICGGVDLQDIRYILVEDIYGGSPSRGELKNIHASDVAIDLATEKLLPGEQNANNGGFKTTVGLNILATPDDVANNKNMILSLEANGDSYQYFNFDIETTSFW